MVNVLYDFEADFKNWIFGKFQKKNLKFDINADLNKLLLQYLGVCMKNIPTTKWHIHKSLDFALPKDNEHIQGLLELERDLATGADVSPRLNAISSEIDAPDEMLNDWGIYHFHLGVGPHKELLNKTKRSSPLLFALFSQEREIAYFIGIYGHYEWSNQSILERAYKNWPELFILYEIKGAPPASLATENIKALRKKHSNHFITFSDGLTIAPFGGGMMASGDSFVMRREADKLYREIQNLISVVDNNRKKIVSALTKQGYQGDIVLNAIPEDFFIGKYKIKVAGTSLIINLIEK